MPQGQKVAVEELLALADMSSPGREKRFAGEFVSGSDYYHTMGS